MVMASNAMTNAETRINDVATAGDRNLAELGRMDSSILSLVGEVSNNQANLAAHKQNIDGRLATAETTLTSLISALRTRVDQHDQMFAQVQATIAQGGGAKNGPTTVGATNFMPWKT